MHQYGSAQIMKLQQHPECPNHRRTAVKGKASMYETTTLCKTVTGSCKCAAQLAKLEAYMGAKKGFQH